MRARITSATASACARSSFPLRKARCVNSPGPGQPRPGVQRQLQDPLRRRPPPMTREFNAVLPGIRVRRAKYRQQPIVGDLPGLRIDKSAIVHRISLACTVPVATKHSAPQWRAPPAPRRGRPQCRPRREASPRPQSYPYRETPPSSQIAIPVARSHRQFVMRRAGKSCVPSSALPAVRRADVSLRPGDRSGCRRSVGGFRGGRGARVAGRVSRRRRWRPVRA